MTQKEKSYYFHFYEDDVTVPAQFQVPRVMEIEFSAVFFQLGICYNPMQGKSV